jgi:hypothetical protein
MVDRGPRLSDALFPAIAVVFVVLYVVAIQAGTDPEIALIRAGFAGVVLASLGRAAEWILTRPGESSQIVTAQPVSKFDVIVEDDDESSEPTQGHGGQDAPGPGKE